MIVTHTAHISLIYIIMSDKEKVTKIIKKPKLDIPLVIDTRESIPFLDHIPHDKQQLLELKYVVYIDADEKSIAWNIIDHKYRVKSANISSQSAEKDSNILVGIHEVLHHLYTVHSKPEEQEHMHIQIVSSNVYATNVLREWMYLWAPDQFIGRPNDKILKKLFTLISPHQNNIKYQYCVHHEHFPKFR